MRIILLFILTLIIAACSSSTGYNPTVFDYHYDQQRIAAQPIKKVILAPISMGVPVPSYLQKRERKVKRMVKSYLENHGYQVLPNYHFENAWKQTIRSYGNVYDPSTGKIDIKTWQRAMSATGKILRQKTDADAVIFADLFVHKIQHSNSMRHYARWWGVTRKPALKGTGGVPIGFDWTQSINAASLRVSIYDMSLTRVFNSRGGIDTLSAIDLKRSNPAFVRRKTPLKNEDNIEEGIELAFHPFIPMKTYPGNP